MTRKKLTFILLGLSLVGYAWLTWNYVDQSSRATPPETCLFKALTGLPCPSCGTTRAVLLLAHGNLRGSLLLNPLGCFFALALVIVPLWLFGDALRHRESLFRWYVAAEKFLGRTRWLQLSAITLVLINWVWNISKGL